MKRAILFILVFMLLTASTVMLPSCDETTAPPSDVTGGGGNLTDAPVSESETVDETDLPEQTDPPATEETTAEIVLPTTFELTPEVTVIYSCLAKGGAEKAAAERLAAAIKEHLGFDCAVLNDWTHDVQSGSEIIIGNCPRRSDTALFTEIFYPEGYGYSVLSDVEVNISANKNEKLAAAVDLFVDEVVKTKMTSLKIGRESIKNNEKPNVNYTINGKKLENFVIVAEKQDAVAVNEFKAYCKGKLYTNLEVITPEEYRGGDAIMIGSYGAISYNGFRYVIRSGEVNGSMVVTVDGETRELRKQGLELLRKEYMSDGQNSERFVVPEERSVYVRTALGDHRLVLTDSVAEELMPGVTYYRRTYDNSDGNNVNVYIVAVSGDSEATFGTYVADFDTKSGKPKLDVKTTGDQAWLLENTGVDVIAATNAGYFHKSAGTNYPYGMQIVDGEVVWEPDGTDKVHGDNWVGITYEGKMVCGTAYDYEKTYKDKLQYGIACGSYIMKDGKLNMQRESKGFSPMTAIALTSDGGFVLVCADGRTAASAGVSFFDTLRLFWDLGLDYTDAYILDGGGSTEMVLCTPDSLRFETQNRPSDGRSRPVGDIIAVIVPKKN